MGNVAMLCAYPGCMQVAEIIPDGRQIPAGSAGRQHVLCPQHENGLAGETINYELAPVHPDFAPPSRGVWDWQAIIEMPSNDIVAMVPSAERGWQIMTALKEQAVRHAKPATSTTEHRGS